MFSNLARPRALAFSLLLFPALVCSREDSLFTSSVTYCNPPESLLVQRLEIAFFPRNNTVAFNISASSVQQNVNVSANLFLNAYGMNPVNYTLDLCNVLNGALCPLPTYNFVGADSITLPSTLGVSDMVPGIAFKIPDLEGFAQLTLTEIGTGDVKACVQATLSNGWSAHQPAVEWVTASFVLVALLSALAHTIYALYWSTTPSSFAKTIDLTSPYLALAAFRFLDLFYLYQAIASSAFLNINYPSLYRAFTLNFAWAMGLLSTSPDSSFQASIDDMRHRTGGQLADSTSASAIGLVNRRYSPYNVRGSDVGLSPISTLTRRAEGLSADVVRVLSSLKFTVTDSALPGKTETFNDTVGTAFGRTRTNLAQSLAVQGEVQTVTPESDNVLQAGIPIYVNSVHVGTANAFMTVFLYALVLLAIAVVLLLIGYGILLAVKGPRRKSRESLGRKAPIQYNEFAQSWLIRLALIFLLPLLTLGFYQWTLRDSWLSILLSVLTVLAFFVFFVQPTRIIIRHATSSGSDTLYHPSFPPPSTPLPSLGPLYAQYRPSRYWTFIPVLFLAPFLKAIFIAFVVPSGLAQVILMFLLELFLLGFQIAFKPHQTRGGDVLSTYLGITRVACMGMMFAFVESFNVKAIPRTVVGAVCAVVWAVAAVVVILDILVFWVCLPVWKMVRTSIKGNNGRRNELAEMHVEDSEGSTLEKGNTNELEKGEEQRVIHNMPMPPSAPDFGGVSAATSFDRRTISRPQNPTPDHNIPLDPGMLENYPFPISPSESVSVGSVDDNGFFKRKSDYSSTMTVGSLLPRRWSFNASMPSQSASPEAPYPAQQQQQQQQASQSPPETASISQYSQASPSQSLFASSRSQSRPQSYYSQQSYPSSPLLTPSSPGHSSDEIHSGSGSTGRALLQSIPEHS